MTSHDLARKLLAAPDRPVYATSKDSPHIPCPIVSVEDAPMTGKGFLSDRQTKTRVAVLRLGETDAKIW